MDKSKLGCLMYNPSHIVQAIFNCTGAGASWGGFTTAQYLSEGGDFFGKIIVQYLAYFLGLYFAIGVFLDLFLLGATAFAGVNYSTNAEAFLKAVKQASAETSAMLSLSGSPGLQRLVSCCYEL